MKACRIIRKTLTIALAVYAALFAVFFFDLDGKLLYYVVDPFLRRHYDNMPRKDVSKQAYPMGKQF